MHEHDEHEHRNPELTEEPLDAANQSLSDALRASFRILKGIMMVLVVLYLFSNVRRVDSHEQALQLRLGRLLPTVHNPGLVAGLPFPIDEIVPLPVNRSNDLEVDSHTFYRTKDEMGKSLDFIDRGGGLDPVMDGALLTADAGLVHVRWKLTYNINNVGDYVSEIVGDKVEAAAALIETYVETVGIEIVTELTAEEIIRTRMDYVQSEMKHRINERLKNLGSGITVVVVEVVDPTPPLSVRDAFIHTQRSENAKQRRIRDAEQEQTQILSKAAGVAHGRLIDLLNEIDAAKAAGQPVDRLEAELDRMLTDEVEGEAGRLLKNASAYQTVVVSEIESDVQLYRRLLPEYKRNPRLLIARLWEEAKLRIYENPEVTKFYRPEGSQVRIHIGLDPDQTRAEEERRLLKQGFDIDTIRPRRIVPLGPGNE